MDTPQRPFPTLETPRLLLREMVLEDAPAMFRFLGDAEAMRYYDPRPMQNIEEVQRSIKRHLERFSRNEAVRWAITLKGNTEVIGSCGFFWTWEGSYGGTSYIIAKEYWGQGLASEAMAAMLKCAFTHWPELNRIEAFLADVNIGSRRVLEKNGFRQEGFLRERAVADGQFYNEYLFALLRRDYLAQQR
jgi:ribosomal-protein-alanine N-acetyltransferase